MENTEIIRLSESFPPTSEKNQTYFATVHKTLKDVIPTKFDPQNLIIRTIKSRKELEEIQLLHKEWFPINYNSEYFEAVVKGKSKGLLAELKVVKSNRVSEKIIVGCILYNIRLANTKYMAFSLKDYFKKMKSLYIMTIGVINEYRKHGIASLLLKEALKLTLEKENNNLKYIYLHVVEYNFSAQKFYEKNNFLLAKVKKRHYSIEGKDYHAFVYVLYINGARKPYSYLEILKGTLNKINVPGHLMRFLGWIFSSLINKRFHYKNMSV